MKWCNKRFQRRSKHNEQLKRQDKAAFWEVDLFTLSPHKKPISHWIRHHWLCVSVWELYLEQISLLDLLESHTGEARVKIHTHLSKPFCHEPFWTFCCIIRTPQWPCGSKGFCEQNSCKKSSFCIHEHVLHTHLVCRHSLLREFAEREKQKFRSISLFFAVRRVCFSDQTRAQKIFEISC